MNPFFAAQLGIGLASAGASWWLGNQQAERQRDETEEKVRRMHLQNQQTLGKATAAGAASGFAFGSAGLQKYLTDMQAEFGKQENWALNAGMAEADATEQAAKWSFVTGAGRSGFDFAKNNNYWGIL